MVEVPPPARLPVPAALRRQVADLVRGTRSEAKPLAPPVPISPSILEDIAHFRRQAEALAAENRAFPLAFMRDAETGAVLPVPVRISDLTELSGSIAGMEKVFSYSRLRLRTVDREPATTAFINRLSEFLAVSRTGASALGVAPGSGGGGAATIVTTNRGGDPVFYCLGYFLSTATFFDTSNPATGNFPSGRYSFGIRDAGVNHYDNVVWTCPNPNVTVKLP